MKGFDVSAVIAMPDLESRVALDHQQALKLWLRLLSCTTRIEGVIRSRLRTDFATTLPPLTIIRFDSAPMLRPSGSRSSCAIRSKRGSVVVKSVRRRWRITPSMRVVHDSRRNHNFSA